MAWIQRQGRMAGDDRWKEVHALLEARLEAARPDEITAMAGMIRGNPLVHEYLSSDFLIRAALANPGLVVACAERLANRGDLAGAISASRQAGLETRLELIPYLCVNPAIDGGFFGTLREDDLGEHFLLQCVKEAPWRAAEALGRAMGNAESHYLPPRPFNAFRAQLARLAEIARVQPWPDPNGKDLTGMLRATRNLGLHTNKDNTTLHALRELADIRPEGETDAQNARRKAIAKEARKQLLIAGWDPADPPAK